MSVSNTKPNQQITVHESEDLFCIYASIYGDAYPQEAVAMYSHLIHIRKLYNTKPQFIWRDYDIKFRTIRTHYSDELPWHKFNWELLGEVESSQPLNSNKSGVCHLFKAKGFCNRKLCRYLHTQPSANTDSSSTSATSPSTYPKAVNDGKYK